MIGDTTRRIASRPRTVRRRYKLVDAADHIGYEWTGRAHGSLADALATLAVQRWLEQWLVAE